MNCGGQVNIHPIGSTVPDGNVATMWELMRRKPETAGTDPAGGALAQAKSLGVPLLSRCEVSARQDTMTYLVG